MQIQTCVVKSKHRNNIRHLKNDMDNTHIITYIKSAELHVKMQARTLKEKISYR